MTTDAYTVDKEQFEKEGLTEPGWYHWRFESMSAGEKEIYRDGEPTGEKYPVINGRLVAYERALYDEDGNFDGVEELDPEISRLETFKLAGSGAKKIRTAYQSVTGRALSGKPVEEQDENGNTVTRYRINLLDAAEELIGGEAWNNIFHTKSTPEFPARDLLTNTFKKSPPRRQRVNKPDSDDDE